MLGDSHHNETEFKRLSLFLEGNQQAFGEIYDQYAPAILGVLTRIVKDSHVADECLIKCFQEIWKQKQTIDLSKVKFFTWMIKIAREVATNHPVLKEDHFYWKIHEEIDLVFGTSIKDFLIQKYSYLTANFAGCIRKEQKEALELIYFKNATFFHTAEKLNIPLRVLKAEIIMAIKQLKCLDLYEKH